MKQIKPFLMFVREHHGKAKNAVDLYVSLFPNSRIETIEYWAAGDSDPAGTVKTAVFVLNGQTFMAMDSAAGHQFTFTPAVSLFVECESEDELRRYYDTLLDSRQALMPKDNYGFSKQFGWVNDRFGVSWQLNFA